MKKEDSELDLCLKHEDPQLHCNSVSLSYQSPDVVTIIISVGGEAELILQGNFVHIKILKALRCQLENN